MQKLTQARTAEKARRFYNAGDENRWGRESLPEFEEQVDKWLRWSNVDHTGVVAELGCGRGAFHYLAARYCYIGLDISFEVLSRYMAPRNAIQADIENLPIASGSVGSSRSTTPHPANACVEPGRPPTFCPAPALSRTTSMSSRTV